MKVEVKNLPKSAVQLDISVPVEKVKETYDLVLAEATGSAEIKGFRKGKAPKEIVEKNLDPAKLHGEVVNKLLEKYYVQALKENKVNPISNPKVEIKQFELDKDFEFTAKVAVRPEVKVGDYRKELKKKLEERHKEVQKQKEEALKKGKSLEEKHLHDHLHSQEVIAAIVDAAEVEVPEMLIEDEVDRMKTRLVDQMQNIDMTLEKYLQAKQISAEDLNKQFENQARNNLKAEFAMAQAVKEAGIEVSDEEIEETAKASGNPQAVENLKDPVNKWYIKSVLEKNKLIQGLMEEFEGKGEKSAEKKDQKKKEEK